MLSARISSVGRFKHPTPWDFFRTMENVAGEDLSWFWRGWFLNSWKLDQSVKDVKYVANDPAKGALVTDRKPGTDGLAGSAGYRPTVRARPTR